MDNAKYTVLLKTIMENPETKPLLEKALSTYPIYVQKTIEEGKPVYIPTREELNTKILNRYKYREIGFETVGRFLDELEISMCEIMPYYNQMMQTVEIMNELDSPFDNVDVVETYDEERTDISSGENSSTAKTSATDNQITETKINSSHNGENLKVHSDTPQNNISNLDNYISDATKDTANNTDNSSQNGSSSGDSESNSESSSFGSSSSSGTVTHRMTKKGNQGVNTYAHDMIEFRTSILNIEQMIINDERIKELFMLVY